MNFGRNRWTAGTVGLLLAYAAVSLTVPKNSPALIAFGDIVTLLLMLVATVVATTRSVSTRGQVRAFWALIAAGSFLWTVNQALWTIYEVLLRREIPDPFVGDAILFVHVVPFMAAVALCPHYAQKGYKLYLGTLNFLMLLVWWVFLYAFVIFPDEYVVLNKLVYSRNYDRLYFIENLVLLAALAILSTTTRNSWKAIYRNLFIAYGLYSLSSLAINAAIARDAYYTGSLYDIPLIASVWWMIRTIMLARELNPASDPAPTVSERWRSLPPRLAMLAMLSLPLMGFWAMHANLGRASFAFAYWSPWQPC